MREGTEPFWNALAGVCIRYGYVIRPDDTGCYNCRLTTGGKLASLHSFGIAVDINWRTNPYARSLTTDMPAKMVEEILAITNKDGVRAFRWGGNFSGSKDAMHFELVLSPEQVARGPKVAAPPAAPPGPEVPARNWFGMGDKGDSVRVWQRQLNDTQRAALRVDGGFGPDTHAATLRFQGKYKLHVDGRVGPVTIRAMEALYKKAV